MGKLKTFTRRAFLVTSTAVVGGVAFGAYQLAKTPDNPLPEGDGALNPWVVINQDGVSAVVPHSEMGQGVMTTLAAMVAEELDVDLDAVTVLHGPAAQAYYNSALATDRHYKASQDPAPNGWAASLTQAFPKLLSLQITGGSTSALDGMQQMRMAGASARATLLMAASQQLNIGLDRLRTENGHVIAPDGTRLSYSELAPHAATLDPEQTPRLKSPSEWRYLGKSQPRKDQPLKATGTATFGMDVRLPGMRFASVRMSPRLGGEMISFDASTAETMPGVEKVVDLGNGVAVIARNTWLAIEAVNAIDVTWGDAPYPAENDAIFEKIEAAFDQPANCTLRDEGNADIAFAGDALTAEYRVPYLAHATMEPMNSTALYTDGKLEVWSPNQAPVLVRDTCAAAAGLEAENVEVHTTFLGGGFGRRAMVDFAEIATRVALALPGTPVQTTWSREEDMRHDHYRPGAIARMRGVLENGRIAALDGQMAAPSIMKQLLTNMLGFEMNPSDNTLTEGAHDQPYDIPNQRFRGYAADVAIPVGFWRSVGSSQNVFFHESFIDELAHEAAVDPLDFRLRHIRPQHAPSATVLETVRDMSGWTGKTADNIGRGVAFGFTFGTAVAQVVEVERDAEGLIRLNDMWIAADLGTVLDPLNAEAQLTGGAVFGLSAAIHGQITFSDGMAEQENFPDYDALRMGVTPRFHVKLLQNMERMGGVGEPGTPPAAPALANALFDLTGTRARHLPLVEQFQFYS
ncbi:molybdopterin-dependent oxidoreductase [Aliiroseovarius crassostreae]|uniref:xanthine dehydrogenase family protein molybdopterin-binding subunit n=1 Tax=Aliiroseovarius crassostreae TaxID=154981 RepID=UPI0021AEF940|nr:molybdopterin cofactor-binding domain-containing protein [Aliiroseovarius crassostreae]UWP93269.1 molybdopterin-dependent oxidoreductase [Aliiroseovarius crassostreae]